MYTIKAVAEATGIPAATLRAWERRYAVVRPARTPAGYRIYDEQLIHDLRLMRDLIGWGHPTAQAAAEVTRRRGEGSDEHRLPPPDSLLVAAAEGDPGRIAAAVEAGLGAAPAPVAVREWLLPALEEMGEAWARGELGIAAEHQISHAVHRALAQRLGEHLTTATGPVVLVGLPAGSHHQLGALAFAMLAARDAVCVRYLGADLPPQDWATCAELTRAAAAVIPVPTREDLPAARATCLALASARLHLLAGGRYQDALAPQARPLGHDLPTAVALLRGILDGHPEPGPGGEPADPAAEAP